MSDIPTYMDFVGFTYNGQHSSLFDIIRTSNGDRYQSNLIPDLSDESTDRPGADGAYYNGSNFKKLDIEIPIAYDKLTELGKRKLKQWLYPDNELHELIFDETPYKRYFVKVSSKIQLEDLCFNEDVYKKEIDGTEIKRSQRVYKGTAKIKFTAYNPYAIEVYKNASSYTDLENNADGKYNNFNEWQESSGIRYWSNMNREGKTYGNIHDLYNPGDANSDYEWIGAKRPLTLVATESIIDATMVKNAALEKMGLNLNSTKTIYIPLDSNYILQNGLEGNMRVLFNNFFQAIIPENSNDPWDGNALIVDVLNTTTVLDKVYFNKDPAGNYIFPAISKNYGITYDGYIRSEYNADTQTGGITLSSNKVGVYTFFSYGNAIWPNIYERAYYINVKFQNNYYRAQILANPYIETGTGGFENIYKLLLYFPDELAPRLSKDTKYDLINNSELCVFHPNNIGIKITIEAYSNSLSQEESEYILLFPTAAFTSPKNFTESQKISISNVEIRVNTNRQSIEYCNTEHNDFGYRRTTQWKGANQLLVEGNLGKIPMSEPDMRAEDVFEFPANFATTFIQQNNSKNYIADTEGNISDILSRDYFFNPIGQYDYKRVWKAEGDSRMIPSLNYHYLYL